MTKYLLTLLLGLSLLNCQQAPPASYYEIDPTEMAKTVTIKRDQYGIPHIFGPTDEIKTGPRGRGPKAILKKNKISDITPQEVMAALDKLRVFQKEETVSVVK